MKLSSPSSKIPVIDIAPLLNQKGNVQNVAETLRKACVEHGFFYIIGHGIKEELQEELATLSQAFFDQDIETKMQVKMALAGRAWRGYFQVGDELTSGKPDLKEGMYFGQELSANHPLSLIHI